MPLRLGLVRHSSCHDTTRHDSGLPARKPHEYRVIGDRVDIHNAHLELERAVSPENASREPAVPDGSAFQSYANDAETSPWAPRPAAVALPGSTSEAQEVVKACSRHGLKFKAFSTGWGVCCGPGCDGVVQVALRRMNRILDIDEKNMYAVVEPYAVCAQIQAEAMKGGLTLHIIGAGCGPSPLASVTSMDGTGRPA